MREPAHRRPHHCTWYCYVRLRLSVYGVDIPSLSFNRGVVLQLLLIDSWISAVSREHTCIYIESLLTLMRSKTIVDLMAFLAAV